MTEKTSNPKTIYHQKSTSLPRMGWGTLGVHTYIKISIIAALFYSFYNQEIYSIIQRWITDPSWSHGFLIPFFSLYFINQKKQPILSNALNKNFKPNYLGMIFMVMAILFYPFNIVQLQYAYFRPLGMIATIGAIVLFLGGWKLVKYTWLPVCYLIFAVPLPQRYYFAVTMPMRKLAASITTEILNLVNGLQASARGVVIDIIYHGKQLQPSLDVAEACSGMRLLMAFLALGVAMAYLHYRPAWQRLVLLASTIPIAIICNIVRVTVTGFIYVMGDPKYAQGIYHDALGMMMLPLAFGLYGFIAWFMAELFVDNTEAPKEDIIVRKRND